MGKINNHVHTCKPECSTHPCSSLCLVITFHRFKGAHVWTLPHPAHPSANPSPPRCHSPLLSVCSVVSLHTLKSHRGAGKVEAADWFSLAFSLSFFFWFCALQSEARSVQRMHTHTCTWERNRMTASARERPLQNALASSFATRRTAVWTNVRQGNCAARTSAVVTFASVALLDDAPQLRWKSVQTGRVGKGSGEEGDQNGNSKEVVNGEVVNCDLATRCRFFFSECDNFDRKPARVWELTKPEQLSQKVGFM